jgi:hypothetical protein
LKHQRREHAWSGAKLIVTLPHRGVGVLSDLPHHKVVLNQIGLPRNAALAHSHSKNYTVKPGQTTVNHSQKPSQNNKEQGANVTSVGQASKTAKLGKQALRFQRCAIRSAAPHLHNAIHPGGQHARSLRVRGDAAHGAAVGLKAEQKLRIHKLPVAQAALGLGAIEGSIAGLFCVWLGVTLKGDCTMAAGVIAPLVEQGNLQFRPTAVPRTRMPVQPYRSGRNIGKV